MDVANITSSLFILLLIIIQDLPICLPLVCNYCYQTNLREDCHINVIHCQPGHVCSVETSMVTYKGKGYKKKYRMYRMGCDHYSLCRDRISSGVGPYGYSVVSKICCCQHRCEEPDGVGKGVVDYCPMLWKNYTEVTDDSCGLVCSMSLVTLLLILQFLVEFTLLI